MFLITVLLNFFFTSGISDNSISSSYHNNRPFKKRFKMDEVEDIMCDQCIISPEFNMEFERHNKKSYLVIPATKLWLAVDLVARALLPSVVNFCYKCLRNQQTVVRSVRYRYLPALAAFLANSLSKSLASVQSITFPLQLRALPVGGSVSEDDTEEEESSSAPVPEPSVHCVVLAEPEGEAIADVIFVHGLHGGLDKTWKQGTWRKSSHKLNRQSPVVRRQSTGDLYVPPRQTSLSLKRTFSEIYSKIPRKVARKEPEVCIITEEEIEEKAIIEEMGKDYSACWPQDWLPIDCPNVRVIALNYTTDVLWKPVWQKRRYRTNMVERSEEMIAELVKLNVGNRPIIWAGHSKGGLFIKQILVNAFESRNEKEELKNILDETKSIMFYSVPHKGSSLADFTFPFLRRSVELLEIQRNCNFVLQLHQKFLDIFSNGIIAKPEIFSFIETSFTLMGFMYMKIIAYESADPDIGIKCDVPLDHREICKPAGRDCFLYTELVKLIERCLQRHQIS